MRFGLVGTGYWARVTHAPALRAGGSSGTATSLDAVWGRDPQRTAEVATEFGAHAYDDFDEFLGAVDAVSFSVPPDVQARLAVRAAAMGKHLLLEKPIALDAPTAELLAKAVDAAGVASAVFFTSLYRPVVREWLAAIGTSSWRVGRAQLLNSAALEGPFATPWRQRHGGLWDLGPHALAGLVSVLGPVTAVRAFGEPTDVTHLTLEHDGGAVSTAALSLTTPEALGVSDIRFWGPDGETAMPGGGQPAAEALERAAAELVVAAETGTAHRFDVHFGRQIVQTLDDAQRLVDAV